MVCKSCFRFAILVICGLVYSQKKGSRNAKKIRRLSKEEIKQQLIETPSYDGPKLWNLVPNEYKTIESLEDFKAKIKTWVPENCPCV